MKPLLVVKCGSAIPDLRGRAGDFEDWIADAAGCPRARLAVASVFEGEGLPRPTAVAAVVVSGSAAMVSDREPWSEAAAAWLARAVDAGTKVLGICYGHQLLAHALGGRVGKNPRGRQIGTTRVRAARSAAADDPLFRGLPAAIDAQVTHVESVLEPPPRAQVLATSEGDPHHAIAYGASAWGVQFHPEFDVAVIRGYLEGRRAEIAAEGLDADALIAALRDAPEATSLLARFAGIAGVREEPRP